MKHFRLFFPVLWHKSDYVTTYTKKWKISKVCSDQKTTYSSHVSTWHFMIKLPWLKSHVLNYQTKTQMFYLFIRQQIPHSFTKLRAINIFTVSTICNIYVSHQYPPSFTWYLSAIPVSVRIHALLAIFTTSYKTKHWHHLFVCCV